MDSHKKTYLFVTILVCVISVSAFAAEQAVTPVAEPTIAKAAAEVEKVVMPDFPFYAEIIANDVYVRSGPGTQHYFCGKLSKGDTVKVLSKRFSWLLIVPPKGSFSWISKQYVALDKDNPDVGIVTSEEVRVYAGSEYVAPIHSDRVQLKLNKGNKVALLGEEIGDYYKISPPESAYLWVSVDYIKPLAEPVKIRTLQPAMTEPAVAPAGPSKTETPATAIVRDIAPAIVPTAVPAGSEQLGQYYVLQEQIKAEREKPLAQQDYSKIKKELEKLAKDKDSRKAARYAEFTLGRIKRYELAAEVDRALSMQDTQFKGLCQDIDNAHTIKMAEFQDLGRFAVIGKLKKSNVYGPEASLLHYVITNPAGKVICYALPSGSSAGMDLAHLMGRKVGLVGKIAPHPQTAGALVKFTEIEMIR